MHLAHVSNFLSAAPRPLLAFFVVELCCRLSPETVQRCQQLRNQPTMCLISPSITRSSIGRV